MVYEPVGRSIPESWGNNSSASKYMPKEQSSVVHSSCVLSCAMHLAGFNLGLAFLITELHQEDTRKESCDASVRSYQSCYHTKMHRLDQGSYKPVVS